MNKDKATLVLINSIGNDAGCWQFLGPIDGHPFLYPGHGGRKCQPVWTHQQIADEIVASFDGMLDLVGMSVGGAIAAHILTRHPNRVRSALIGCSGSISRVAENAKEAELHRRTQIERGELALRSGMAAVIDATFPRWFTPQAIRTEAPGVAYARRTMLAMDPQGWYDIWCAGANSVAVTPQLLSTIRQPVTLLSGTHDAAASRAGLVRAHELIPNSRLEIVAGPHMLHLEEPLTLLSALDRHFDWVPIGNRLEAPIGALDA